MEHSTEMPAKTPLLNQRPAAANRDMTKAKVESFRLLFKSPAEEAIAVSWASRLAGLIGAQIMQLRTDSALSEMLAWACGHVDSMDFVCVFEPELRMDFAEFLDQAENVTFREMVEHAARRTPVRYNPTRST